MPESRVRMMREGFAPHVVLRVAFEVPWRYEAAGPARARYCKVAAPLANREGVKLGGCYRGGW